MQFVRTIPKARLLEIVSHANGTVKYGMLANTVIAADS